MVSAIYVRKVNRQGRQEQGYSLVEVMVSMLLVSIVLLPLMSMFVSGNTAHTEAGRETQATNLARCRMEELKAWGYEEVYGLYVDNVKMPYQEAPHDVNEDVLGEARVEIKEELSDGFTRTTRIVPEEMDWEVTEDSVKLLQIEVEVSWELRQERRSVKLVSCLTRR